MTSAYASGFLTLEEAVHVLYKRTSAVALLAGSGRLLAVGAGLEAIKKLLPYQSEFEIACINGPSATVLAGSEDTLLKYKALMKQNGVPSTLIQGDIAFHSSMVDPAIPVIQKQLAFLDGSRTRTAHLAQFISTVTGEEEKTMSADYWCHNLRGTVQLQKAVETVFSDPETSPDLVIEVSTNSETIHIIRNTHESI